MGPTHKKNPAFIKKELKRIIVVSLISVATFFAIGLFFLRNLYVQTRAAPQIVIDRSSLNTASDVEQDRKTIQFLIESKQGRSLFKIQNRDLSTVLGTLGRGVKYQQKPGEQATNLLPDNVLENTVLKRTVDDSKDKFLAKRGFKLSDSHFMFEQKIDNVPVLGSSISMHVTADNEVYRMSGNILANEELQQIKLLDDQAKKIALTEAGKDVTNPKNLEIHSATRVIVNKKLLGISDDATNYLTLAVNINVKDDPAAFASRYYVDLNSGEVIYQRPLATEGINRKVYDCSVNPSNCPVARQEGQGPVNKGSVDLLYDLFGSSYNFYKDKFTRDSYDNQGAQLEIGANTPTTGIFKCPNAAWLNAPYEFWLFCPGMVTSDIVAHEYTHAVVEHTAGLPNTDQGGLLNESLADIFSHAVNPDNWTLGEGSTPGIFRYMDDPTKSPSPGGPQPDKLFSQNYYCGVNQSAITHINNGVFNKAFYLMVDGGDFNGCQMAGQGLDKIIPIVYRALTVYLTPTANIKSMYDAMNLACHDLYTSASATCVTVKSAMEATEMDQQSPQIQLGAKCQNIQPQPPACRSVVPSPSISPAVSPTLPVVSITPEPTTSQNITPTSPPTITPTGVTIPTVTPANTFNPTGTYTDWHWPVPPPGGSDHFAHTLTIENYPENNTGYFWAHQFGFLGGDGGYIGLQTQGPRPDGTTGKVAIFSIWKAVSGESDGIARPFSGEGEGYQTIIPYEWAPGRRYNLNIMYIDTTNTQHRWAAWVYDEAADKSTLIGLIGVPLNWNKLSNFSIMWTERYSGPQINKCDDVGYARASFTDPVVDFVKSPESHFNHLAQPASCPNSNITDITDGVRQEMGIPENQIIPTPVPTGSLIPTSTPTPVVSRHPITTIGQPPPTPTPSQSPNSNMTLNLRLKFQGIASLPKGQSNTIEARVTLIEGGLSNKLVKTVKFTSDGHGLWKGTANFDSVPITSGYKIFIKGQKHIQKGICTTNPSEKALGAYHCTNGKITLNAGVNELDFSGILQMSGDLPSGGNQDGVINSIDLVTIVKLVGKTDAESLKIADVNLDGIVDSQDFSLVIATLSQQFDDE